MNYDRIILELLDRVKKLEEQMEDLSHNVVNNVEENSAEIGRKETIGITTQEVVEYIETRKAQARRNGLSDLTLTAGEIAKELGASNRLVVVVNAMRKAMKMGDEILTNATSNYSIAFEVCYKLSLVVGTVNTRGRVNSFKVRWESSPQNESGIREMKVFAGREYLMVFDEKDNCVGVVFEHFENRGSPANGQAEICFFDQYYLQYGRWHRMFVSGYQGSERIKYTSLESQVNEEGFYQYKGYIK